MEVSSLSFIRRDLIDLIMEINDQENYHLTREGIIKFVAYSPESRIARMNKIISKCAIWTLKRDSPGYDKKIKRSEKTLLEYVIKHIDL